MVCTRNKKERREEISWIDRFRQNLLPSRKHPGKTDYLYYKTTSRRLAAILKNNRTLPIKLCQLLKQQFLLLPLTSTDKKYSYPRCVQSLGSNRDRYMQVTFEFDAFAMCCKNFREEINTYQRGFFPIRKPYPDHLNSF